MIRSLRVFLLAGVTLAAMAASASADMKPVGADSFNMKHLDFDAATLTRENFYDVLVPVAKQEGEVNLYSFAASFPVFWKEAVIPGFEKKYGIRVNFYDVKEDVAKQQLIAVHQADQDSRPTPISRPARPRPRRATRRSSPICRSPMSSPRRRTSTRRCSASRSASTMAAPSCRFTATRPAWATTARS